MPLNNSQLHYTRERPLISTFLRNFHGTVLDLLLVIRKTVLQHRGRYASHCVKIQG